MTILIIDIDKFEDKDNTEYLDIFLKKRDLIKKSQFIILNLNDTIRSDNNHEQLLYFKKLCGKLPIFVNFMNEKIINYNYTVNFLCKHNFYCNLSIFRPFIYNNINIFNIIDANIINNNRCLSYVLPISISENFDNLIIRFLNALATNEINIVLYKTNNIIAFVHNAKKLINNGIHIVYGYGNVNICKYILYENNVIFYNSSKNWIFKLFI